MYTLTADRALRIGAIFLFVIPILLIPGEIYLLWLLIKNGIFPFSSNVPTYLQFIISIIVFFAGILVSPYYWYLIFFHVWYVWAFTRVRNVHELRRKSAYWRILREDANLKSRLKLATRHQKEKILKIEERFSLQDEIFDDGSIPEDSVISKTKSDIWFILSIALFMICIPILGISTNITFIILFVVHLLFVLYGLKKYDNRKYIVNSYCISYDGKEYLWDNISDFKTSFTHTLNCEFEYKKQYVYIWFDNTDHSYSKIDDIFQVNILRYKERNKTIIHK